MNLSASSLFATLMISTIGFAYLQYGRKRPAPMFVVSGLLLMTYSYFVDSFAWTLGIGALLLGLPFIINIG